MNLGMLLFWAAVGWCGNEIRRPRRHYPPPPPWLSMILAVIGGIIGGWALNRLLPGEDTLSRGDLLSTGVGALVGGIVLSSIPSLFARNSPPHTQAADVLLQLPEASPQVVRNLDTQTLAATLQTILGEPTSEARLNDLILRGGRVRVTDRLGDEAAWKSTVWRRSGPFREREHALINPPEFRQDIDNLRG